MYLQSIKSVKHNAANSVNRSILKKSRHIGFGVFIVHSSMYRAEKYEGALTPALEGGTDLVPAQYEGGLKIWECSEDLVR
jgi:hypothetical protein